MAPASFSQSVYGGRADQLEGMDTAPSNGSFCHTCRSRDRQLVVCQLSEIWLVRRREHGFVSGRVVRVFRAFGADKFLPFT